MKKIVITPDKFDRFRRALGYLAQDLAYKPKEEVKEREVVK